MATIAYTRTTLVSDVRLLLQERTAARFQDADLERWADEGIAFVAAATRSLRKADATVTSVSAGDGSYDIPADSVGAWAISDVYYDGTPLEKTPFDRRRQRVEQGLSPTTSATPKYWSPFGDKIYLTPPNTVSGKTITMFTAYLPAALSAAGSPLPLRVAYGAVVEDYMLHRAFMLNGQREEANRAWGRCIFKLKTIFDKTMPDIDPEAQRGT